MRERPQVLHAFVMSAVALLLIIVLASPYALGTEAKFVSNFLTWGEIPNQLVHSDLGPSIRVSSPEPSMIDYPITWVFSGLLNILVFTVIAVPTLGLMNGYLWFKTSWYLLSVGVGLLWSIIRLTLVITTGHFYGFEVSDLVHYLLTVFDFLWIVAMWSYCVPFLKREKMDEEL